MRVLGTVPWRMDDPTRVPGMKLSWGLLAGAVEGDRPTVVPSSKCADCVPPAEDASSKASCPPGVPAGPSMAPQGQVVPILLGAEEGAMRCCRN